MPAHAITRSLLGALALAGAALIPVAAHAQAQAVSTAANHAGLAANAADLNGVRTHLRHVLNCLVGPNGEGFDASAGNPCGANAGAIPQTSDAAARARLETVATRVRTALTNQDLNNTKQAATEIAGMLRQ